MNNTDFVIILKTQEKNKIEIIGEDFQKSIDNILCNKNKFYPK